MKDWDCAARWISGRNLKDAAVAKMRADDFGIILSGESPTPLIRPLSWRRGRSALAGDGGDERQVAGAMTAPVRVVALTGFEEVEPV